jgi:tRNA(His) guanylyltransferase
MPESYSNDNAHDTPNQTKSEIFSQIQIPPETPFFTRLDGRRFEAVAEKLKADKPFDKAFAKCLTAAAQALYENSLNPALIYVASDEINALFIHSTPYKRRIEKVDSALAGVCSSAFSLCVLKKFQSALVAGFDSRIVVTSKEQVIDYLAWRQQDAWRNHNNAYAY